jgi:hypothetical protein
MVIDWELTIRIGVPIATAIVAAIINRVLQERPKLIKFVSHTSQFEWWSDWRPVRIPGDPEPVLGAPNAAPPEPAGGEAGRAAAPPPAMPAAVPVKVWANSHSIFVKNVGRKTATSVRIGHNARPYSFQIFPAASYELLRGQGNAWEICIPTLVPNEFVQIAYLYDPRMQWATIDSYVKSDECMAITKNVAPVPLESWPKWIARHAMYYLGIAAAAYLLVRAAEWVYRTSTCLGACT